MRAENEKKSRAGVRGALALLLAGLAAATAPRPVDAQTEPAARVWLGLGIATAGVRNVDANAGWSAELGIERAPVHYAIRMTWLADLGHLPELGSDRVREVGALYGRVTTTSWGHASVAAGLSVVTVDGCDGTYEKSCTTIGVPLVAEARLESQVIGLALQAFGDINPKATFGGLGLSLRLGWMP